MVNQNLNFLRFMKSFILSLLFCLTASFIFAQDLSSSNCAVFSFRAYAETEFYKNLDDIEAYSVRENLKLERTKKRLERLLTNAAFEELQNTFKEKYNINLDKDFLKDKIYYNDMGYPFVFLKKAVKKGDADYYFSFNVAYTNATELGSAVLKMKQIKPVVTINMVVGDSNGKKIYGKIKGVAKSDKPLKARELGGSSRFDLTDESSADVLSEPLIELMKQAVFNLTENFSPKS